MESPKARARSLWNAGRPLEAGRILLDSAAPARAVLWAATVLDLCCEYLQTRPRELAELVELVRDESRWAHARGAFESIRRLTLRVEQGSSSAPPTAAGVLYLGENVAKLAYNATAPRDPFDADVGPWVVANAHWVAQRVTDDVFRERLWDALSSVARDDDQGTA